ncbi:NADH:ubiquinone oxidoreductase, partial [Phlyctochytrium bullatum]
CSKCEALQQELDEARRDFDEFQAESREYEAELDREVADLKKRNQQLAKELEELRGRYSSQQREANNTINSQQKELELLRTSQEEHRRRTRELEIFNAELEQNVRVKSASAEDLEVKYNKILERTIYLEHELDSKAELAEEAQRLKDELRDTVHELGVVRTRLEEKERLFSKMGFASGNRPLESPSLSLTTAYSDNEPISNAQADTNPRVNTVEVIHLSNTDPSDYEVQPPPKSPPLQSYDRIPPNHDIIAKSRTGPITTLNELLQRAKSLEMRITAAKDKYVQPLLLNASNPLSPPLKANTIRNSSVPALSEDLLHRQSLSDDPIEEASGLSPNVPMDDVKSTMEMY